MKQDLTIRQFEILVKLRAKNNAKFIDKYLRERLSNDEIERLVNIIADEFHMNGLLPNWEPNSYGLELMNLLDIVNKPRII
jgi:hypothetical protein